MAGVDRRDSLNLFGVDLRALWQAFRTGCGAAMRLPMLAWLLPTQPVRLVRSGGESSMRDGRAPARELSARSAQFTALEFPDDLVLRTRMTLPLLGADAMARGVGLRILQLSPFSPDETVAGWRAQPILAGGFELEIAIASRIQVQEFLARAAVDPAAVEVWADVSDPIVLRGFGESRRFSQATRQAWVVAGLSGLAAVLLGLLMAVPAWQMEARAARAEGELERLKSSVRDDLGRKDEFARLSERLARLGQESSRAGAVAELLAQITRAVPDDAYVRRLSIDAHRVQLQGMAADAAKLLQILGREGGFPNVRAPGAITRNQRTGQESFVIEFDLPEAAKS